MAELTYQRPTILGAAFAKSAASAGGDSVRPRVDGFILVDNASAGAITVTVTVPGNTRYSQANPDFTVSVGAGAAKFIGPFPGDLADPADGLADISYSAVTSVTVAAISL